MEWPDAVLSVLIELVSSVLIELVLLVLVGRVSLVVVGSVSSVLFGRAVPLVPLYVQKRSKFRRLKQTTSDADAAPRQIRRQHRRPTTQLPRTYRNTTRAVLARSIRCSGRVPIDQHKNRAWPLSSWQTIKNIFLPSPTNPKSAFTLTDWQYQPITPTGLAKRYPYCGGSILRLSLHPHENRSHLKRSLNADKSGRRARRLVVIASVKDMFKPTSLVRCIVVNSYTLRLEKGDSHAVIMHAADPLSVEESNMHLLKQKNIPADALWLIVPTSNYRAPSTFWGQMPERHNNQTMPLGPTAQECDDVGDKDFVKERMTFVWRIRLVLWLFIGLMMLPTVWSALNLFPQVSGPTAILVFWFVVYVIPLIAALSYLAITAFKAWWWRRRDGQTFRTWKGRTEECLIMGAVLRFGPFFSEKEWKEYYAHVFHKSDGDPIGSA